MRRLADPLDDERTMRIEKPLAMSAHLGRGDRTRHAMPLRPLHRRGNRDPETRGDRTAALPGLDSADNAFTKIIG
jgi:hypothetical protein